MNNHELTVLYIIIKTKQQKTKFGRTDIIVPFSVSSVPFTVNRASFGVNSVPFNVNSASFSVRRAPVSVSSVSMGTGINSAAVCVCVRSVPDGVNSVPVNSVNCVRFNV